MRLFPQRQPVIAGLDYAGVCVQARSVGGEGVANVIHASLMPWL